MFAEILNYILDLKYFQEKFKSATQRDAMRCVPIFHDALKTGEKESPFTVFDHPLLAGKWVREARIEHDIDSKVKEAIANMCEAHSGQWSTSKHSKVVLPEPVNDMQAFIHMCDVLSSRHNIDMDIPEYLEEVFSDVEVEIDFDPETIFTFGKYKGERMIDIYNRRPDYIDWCLENISKPNVQSTLKAMKKYVENSMSA
jgi:hypothetical protein